jgi:hypothetical protein
MEYNTGNGSSPAVIGFGNFSWPLATDGIQEMENSKINIIATHFKEMLKCDGKDDKMLNDIVGEWYALKPQDRRPLTSNITKKESMAWKSLKDDKEIRILQAGTGNCTVVLKESTYHIQEDTQSTRIRGLWNST